MEQSSENSDSDLSDSWAIINEDLAPQENGNCTEAERHSDSEESVEILHTLDEEDAGARTGAETDGISVISESDDLAEEFLDNDILIKEKKYIHHPNKKINTILNIVLAMTVASVLGLGIGHYLGSEEEEDQRNAAYLVMELENKILRHHLCHIILLSHNNLQHQNDIPLIYEQNKNYLTWVMRSMNLKCSKINTFGNRTSLFPSLRSSYNINYNPFLISKRDELTKDAYANEGPQKVTDEMSSSCNSGEELFAKQSARQSDISLPRGHSVQETSTTTILNSNEDTFSTIDHTSNTNVAEILLEIKSELIESIGQTFQLKEYIDNIDSKITKLISHDNTCNLQQARVITNDIMHNLKQFIDSRSFLESQPGTQYTSEISDAKETDQYCKIADYLKGLYREVPKSINTLTNVNTESLQKTSTHDTIMINEKYTVSKGSDKKSDQVEIIHNQRQLTKNDNYKVDCTANYKSDCNHLHVQEKSMKYKHSKQSNKHKHYEVNTSSKYENKEYLKHKRKLYKKLHNFTNTSGEWLIQMGKGRSDIREMNHKSDWLFDRATSRKNKRKESEAAYWYFQRAHERKEQRYDDGKNFDYKCHFKTSDREHNEKKKYHETKNKCNQNIYPKYSKVKKWVSKAFMTATKILKF